MPPCIGKTYVTHTGFLRQYKKYYIHEMLYVVQNGFLMNTILPAFTTVYNGRA